MMSGCLLLICISLGLFDFVVLLASSLRCIMSGELRIKLKGKKGEWRGTSIRDLTYRVSRK